jgi:hypothetical protein
MIDDRTIDDRIEAEGRIKVGNQGLPFNWKTYGTLWSVGTSLRLSELVCCDIL